MNASGTGITTPMGTGYRSIDAGSGGMKAGELILLGGRPGMGKTALALKIASNVVQNENKNVLLVSLESGFELLAKRLNGFDTANEKTVRLVKNGGVLCSSEQHHPAIHVYDSPSMTLDEVEAELGKLDCVGFVAIDYIQLLSCSQDLSDTLCRLKDLAKKHRVPILLVSQLSRATDEREDHRPLCTDLTYYETYAKYVDAFWLLYRPACYDKSAVQSEAVCIITDSSNVSREEVLCWNEHHAMFSDPA